MYGLLIESVYYNYEDTEDDVRWCMKMNKKANKIVILSVTALLLMILPLSILAYAQTDLPIDIDEVYQIEGMGTRAVTVGRGVDLFSDSSREVTEAMITQHEAIREEALTELFDPLYRVEELSGEERLMDHVVSSGLFGEGASFRESGEEEVTAEGTPILIIIIAMIMCGVGGFVIAMLSLQKKKGQGRVR
jgi:hypothetical protein